MYIELPAVPGTPESRTAALRISHELLRDQTKKGGAIFQGSDESVSAPAAGAMIRLATYIETGHDYKDLHPSGKRRPRAPQIRHYELDMSDAFDEDGVINLEKLGYRMDRREDESPLKEPDSNDPQTEREEDVVGDGEAEGEKPAPKAPWVY